MRRYDFYFRQKVKESELDAAFDAVEVADRALATDMGIFGIFSGLTPTQHAPVANLSVDLTAPGKAFDQLGQRLYVPTSQVLDVSQDLNGIPTAVVAPGNSKILGLFLHFKRALSDPRVDGNGVPLYYQQDESFELRVRQGAEGLVPVVPPLQAEEVLLADVTLVFGQTQVLDANISVARRQDFVFTDAQHVSVNSGTWNEISGADVQAALDSADEVLGFHFDGTADRHPAGDIDFTPYSWIGSSTVGGAVKEMVDDLALQTAGTAGANRIGGQATASSPDSLTAASVRNQLDQLLTHINAHLNDTTAAHAGTAISNTPAGGVAATTVQAAINELDTEKSPTGHVHDSTVITDVYSRTWKDGTSFTPSSIKSAIDFIVSELKRDSGIDSGTTKIGSKGIAGATRSLTNARSIYDHLVQVLGWTNTDAADILALDGRLDTIDLWSPNVAFKNAENIFAEDQHIVNGRQFVHDGSADAWALWFKTYRAGSNVRFYHYGTGGGTSRTEHWITINAQIAAGTGTCTKDDDLAVAGALRITRNGAYFYHRLTGAGTWNVTSGWSRWWHIDLANWTFNVGGDQTTAPAWGGTYQETGTWGLAVVCQAGTRALPDSMAINFKQSFSAAPGSVTLTVSTSSNWATLPTVSNISAHGARVSGTSDSIAQPASAYTYGTYLAA